GRSYDDRFSHDLRQLAAGKPVRFRHDCNDVDLVRAYQRATCVVLPSVYRSRYGHETQVPELLGQTLLEAMACGTAVIGTSVASLPEVVIDGETGFLVPPNNPAALRVKLEWLRDHQAEAVQLGWAGRRRVIALFNWEAVVRRCLAAYADRGRARLDAQGEV
ncbi:MAG: glycosyltransferase, partial [Longimicrobiales bacterium]